MKTTSDAITEALDEFRDVYGMNLTTAVVAAFDEVLGKYEPAEISYAAVEHLKTSKFAPRPSELLSLIRLKRERESLAATKDEFWRGTEEAAERKHKGAFNRPEGVSVLDWMDQLRASGMSAEEAAEEMCK